MRRHPWFILVVLMVGALALLNAPRSLAASAVPRWELQIVAEPSVFEAGVSTHPDYYEFLVTNVGGAPLNGTASLTVHLPEGVTPQFGELNFWNCPTQGEEFTCTNENLNEEDILTVTVEIPAGGPADLAVTAEISGAGAAPLTRTVVTPRGAPQPGFEISRFLNELKGPAGETDVTAGGHPSHLLTQLATPNRTFFNLAGEPRLGIGLRNARDLVIDLPPGLVGNPTAVPQCPTQVFLADPDNCSAGSQVGTFSISGNGAGLITDDKIFSLVPEVGFPAEFGFFDTQLNKGILAQATLAHTDRGYVVRFAASELLKLIGGPFYLQARFFGNPELSSGILGAGEPFLTAPADCVAEPLRTTLHLDTWTDPAPVFLNANQARDFGTTNFLEPQWYNVASESPAVVGCEALSFNPSAQLRPDEQKADSPTGLGVEIAVPQNEEPGGLATPPLRDATVTLPKGLVIDPSSADGLSGCTEADLALDSTDPGNCPQTSRLGTATLHTQLIDHPLEGSVYLGTPECSPCSDADATAGRLLKLYIEINDPKTGVVVKLPGTVAVDPGTGQLTASFTENPQLPFEDLELHFKSGSRAPLTTPPTCGEYTTTTDLMPWSAPQSGPDAKPQSRFAINSGPGGSACPAGEGGLTNKPSFEAGTIQSLAGTYSPFVLKVSRENGSQRIGALEATLPAGLLGRIAGVPYCSDASIAAAGSKGGRSEQASPSCPLASEVGTVNVGAGSGTPFYVQGHVYLAGPYKGAPLSLEIITSAVAGPFDLGTVAVRTALYVNESTAQIHAVSDPIPSILAGIPLDVRSIALNMNRPQFTLNPTSCDAMAVLGSTTSTLGQTATLQNRFQVGGCKGLEFKPNLKLAFTGQTKRTGFPAVKAVLTQPKGQNANLAGAQVILPKGMLIANAHINNPCTRVQFNSGKLPGEACPAKSILGTAKVWTPLLEKPEEGKVYFRSNGGERELPDLAVALRGQIPLQLLGFIDSVGKKNAEVRRVRSRFQNLPDAPVSRFELKLSGGKKGLLQNSKNLCKVSDKAKFDLTGQNGATHDTEPKVQVACGKKGNGGGKRKSGSKRK